MKQGKPDEAIAACQEQVEITPDHEDAWYNMGLAFQKQNKPDKAIIAFYKHAEILQAKGKLDEAVAAYQNLLAIKPDHELALYNIGCIFQQRSKPDEAITAFQKLLEMKPLHEDAWNIMGLAFQQQGNLDKAIAAYQKQLKVKPGHKRALREMFTLGKNLQNVQGKLDEAIAVYQKLLEVKPDHEHAWHNMGDVLWQQDKLDEAFVAYQKQIEVKPDDWFTWIDMRHLLEVQGKPNEARAAFHIMILVTSAEPGNYEFVILKFYAWLLNLEQSWQSIMTEIDELELGVEFEWDFSDTIPIIESQDVETQQITRHFIEFFEGKIDLPTLKARLAGHDKKE